MPKHVTTLINMNLMTHIKFVKQNLTMKMKNGTHFT